MNRYRLFRVVFSLSAVLLSDIMCAVVAYNYCALQWGGRYAAYSFPPSAAFLYSVPYGLGIALCILLAVLFSRKERTQRG